MARKQLEPDFHRGVEHNAGIHGYATWLFKGERCIQSGIEIDDILVRHHHPFGLPRRTGGVNHVRQMVWGQSQHLRIEIAFRSLIKNRG